MNQPFQNENGWFVLIQIMDELKDILEKDYKLQISDADTFEIGTRLLQFFDLLNKFSAEDSRDLIPDKN